MTAQELLSSACEVSEAGPADAVDGTLPQVVARPRSTEETSALLRACHDAGLAVVVRGHGSKLAWGRPPERLDVVLDTTGMDALVEHSRGDLIATAGAGMPLARLQERLAEGGHQLVVDDLVGGGPGSTLGGAVAVNLSGPRRMWTGAVRDLVIGVRLVRADGTVAKAGGKVVKNVAGYDLSKLMTGSFGTLAVITEVTVRLHPVPEADRWVGTSVEPERLAAVLTEVVHSQEVPHAVEVRVRPGAPPAVVTMLSGTEAGVSARAEALRGQLAALGCEAKVHDVAPPWWGVLLHPGQVGGTQRPEGSRPVLLKVSARLSGVPELLAQVAGVEGTGNGSAGAGVLYVTLPADERAGAKVEVLRGTATQLGGSAVVLDAPPELKADLDVWGPVPAIDLMRRVKDEFDPTRVLAPGRFVGGL
ncbi:FAD-binding oxidoreductase [Ornithinimicrobium pratense]|uniref:FAD-binding oxidoreductase n=1 Tax=Ornithinimicrobium pratense TaxID=2593973 RepID=A0A5J6V549_9MICO|nr:FAD-binding oxidoreductase [Ornithinimicrobium pratense]QFG68905.1 FAD-binding oxidoreductase [Ornithinimicrobium pratense]